MGDPYVYNITIPPSPNWYEVGVMTYTPDDWLIYGSKADLIILKYVAKKSVKELTTTKIMRRAHSQRITSLGINPMWGENGSLLVTTADDKFVKVWDMQTYDIKVAHQQHLKSNKIVSAAFAGSERVVSVSDDGHIIVWNITNNEMVHITNVFNSKVTVTSMSICPHYPKIAAFGTKSGLILVVDLRGTGKIVYPLRGHDKEVISLDWCPIPYNVFPKNPNNRVCITPEQLRAGVHVEGGAATASLQGPPDTRENVAITTIVAAKDTTPGSPDKCSTQLTITTTTIPQPASQQQLQGTVSETSTDTLIRTSGSEEATRSADSLSSDTQQVASAQTASQTSTKVTSVSSDVNQKKGRGRRYRKKKQQQFAQDQANISGSSSRTDEPKDGTKKDQASVAGSSKSGSRTAEPKDGTKKDQANVAGSSKSGSRTDEPKDGTKKDQASVAGSSKSGSRTDEPKDGTKKDEAKQGSGKISILKRPSDQADKKPCSSQITILKRPESSKDNAKQAQTEDSVTSLPVDVQTSEATLKLESDGGDAAPGTETCPEWRKTYKPDSELHDLFKPPPFAKVPYCEKCGIEIECACVNTVKMIAPNVEQARKEFLLVSSARESMIIIWRVGTGGTMQTIIRLPTPKKQKKGRSTDRPWITVKWPLPNKIYCSSRNNELVQWTVPKPPRGEGETMKVIHDDHAGLLFSIATSVVDYINRNWELPLEHVVWTTSQDRQLICYRIDGEETEIEKLAMYSTFGGVPECLARNDVNPYRVAVGTSGAILKIWDMTHTTDKLVSMQQLTQKIHSRVTCVVWHPNNENIVAFGTQEGRVGFFDLEDKSGVPKVMPHLFTKEVYKLQWAPLKDKSYALFITSEGKLVYWKIETPEAEPVVVETPAEEVVYNFAWKRDFSCLLVSFKSCLLLTYSAELRQIDSSITPQKLSLLTWNTLSHTNDVSKEIFCMTYAGVLNRRTMVVLDKDKATEVFVEKIIGRFEVQNDQINVIVWNNFGTRLAVGTEDGFIFIWDLPTHAVIWNFINETYQGITSVIFSPLGTEHIFCGTRDCVLKVFRQKDFPPFDAASLSAQRSLISLVKEEESKKCRDATLKRIGASEDRSQKEKHKKSIELLPVFHRSRTSANEFLADLKRLYTYVTDGVLEKSSSSEVDLLDIFGAQESMMQLVAQNELIMKERGKGLDLPLAMFQSDCSRYLSEAVRSRRVTPAVIALAPFVSQRETTSSSLWLEAVETYAEILNEDPHSDPIEAATYYLACHKVREAIDLLVSRNMFKEALALAKCRSAPDSPMVAKVVEAWAKYALENGNFERAAECFVYLGKFGEAATALFKRTEPEILLFAIELAEKANVKDSLYKAALHRYQTYLDQGEHTKKSLKTETIADVLLNVRKADARHPTSSAGPSTSVEPAAGPSSASTVADEDDGLPPPSFLARVPPIDDFQISSPSVCSLLSSSSETFLTRGHQDPTSHVIPAAEDVGPESADIIDAIQAKVIEEAQEDSVMSDDSSLKDGATVSTTEIAVPHPEETPPSSGESRDP